MGSRDLLERALRFTLMFVMLACFGHRAVASTAPPHEYYLLSPEPLTGAVTLMSLEPNNTITFGDRQVTLRQYETATVQADAFTSGTRFAGTGFFTIGSNENAADLLVPDDFAGTQFVIPHLAGTHRYYFLSPSGTAQVTIAVGASTYQVTAAAGVVNEFDAGSVTGLAGRVTSNVPIVVARVAYSGGAARDAYPVPPAANELFGIRSQNTVVGALSDGTTVTVYASNGNTASYSLNAGETATITAGANGNQGQGSALRLVANAPIAAVQYDDGDGTDATAFWTSANFTRRHGLPVNAQYLAVACDQASVTLTLYKGANAPEVSSCSGSSTTPGKAYFGSSASGANLTSGWYLISSSPVYAMYEGATAQDEHNLLGLTPVAGPASPTLDSIASPTTSNPRSVSGSAAANQSVRLYVNGLLQATTTADGSGAYSFNAALNDGMNTLYTTAVTSGNESDPSNAVSVEYNNIIPRNQSGTVSGTVVWTPGSPAQPYIVTADNLTVAAGAQLILQPGAQIRFGSGRHLIVNGTLVVNGTSASNVVFTSDLVTPTRGSWPGIRVASGANVSMTNALIEWAVNAVEVASGATFTMTTSTVRNFSYNGLVFYGTSTSSITGSTIDNLNDTGSCIVVIGAASPTIQGNTISNCQYGFYMSGENSAAQQPTVTGNQILSHSHHSVYTYPNYLAGSNLTLNFTNNWWGTSDLTVIAASISDQSDNLGSANLPSVNFGNPLDGPNGSPLPGNYLTGIQTAASMTLTANTAYEVMGHLVVPAGKTLIVQPGATLRFHMTGSVLQISGSLQIGGSGTPVTLTTGKTPPTRGAWGGVRVQSGANVSITNALIEWAVNAVEVASGATFTMSSSTARNFSNNGVVFYGTSTSSITGSTIDNLNDAGTCIAVIGAASPTIQGGTISNCQYGFYMSGENSAAQQPTVTGNQILSHSHHSVYTYPNYLAGSNPTLNFTNNWWGTTDLTAIAASISDLSDNLGSANLPSVNFGNPLDGPNGSSLPGNYLTGIQTAASTTLTANTAYEVMGHLVVPAGKTLIVQPGATLRFHMTGSVLQISGSLQIGGSGTPVTLTTGKNPPTRGAWAGVRVQSGANVTITNALIEWAVNAVEVASGATFTMSTSTVRNFRDNGLVFNGASTLSVTGSTIDNLNDAGTCIAVIGAASPTIQGNTISNCQYGFYMSGENSAAQQPTVTGNQILSHSYHSVYTYPNYLAGSNLTLNFTNNWWGTSDLTVIAASISDQSDNLGSANLPSVNFGNPLDGPGGNPVPGNYLIGALTATATTLTAGSAYEVLGMVLVGPGKSLTVPAGTVLRFHVPQSRLRIDGTLTVQGTAASRAVFTSGLTDPTRGAWYGIEVRSTATNVLIDYALVEWATQAVNVTGTNATISNSIIRNFSEVGIWMSGATSASQITGNFIDNFDGNGIGIYLSAASPAITGNQIHRTYVGIYAIGASNPVITGNAISNNGRGIVLDGGGSNSATAVPNPVITGNDIFDNLGAQIEIYNYGASNPVVINATDNWWGTGTPQAGQHIRFNSSPASTLNYSNPAQQPRTRPVMGSFAISQLYFSPNADAVKDVTAISGTLNQSATWTVDIRGSNNNVIRSYSGSGTAVSASWDGRNGGGQVQPDGVYSIELSASAASGGGMIGARQVVLDNTAPVTVISSPSSGVLSNVVSVPVNGSARDTYLTGFTLEYGAGTTPSAWSAVASGGAAGVTNGLLGTWTVGSTEGAASLANGAYVLRLTTNDKAGNAGQVLVPMTLDLLSISGVTQNLRLMRPLSAEQLQVSFTLGAPANVALRIYPEAGGALIKEITQNFTSGGAKTMTWDGRTSAGAYVVDEAYSFAIVASDGSRTATYDPPASPAVGNGEGIVDASFNAHKNDFWKMNYAIGQHGRVRMQVSGCTAQVHYPYNWVPLPLGVHPLIWDGRDAAGKLVSGTCDIFFDAPLLLKPNSVIVRGVAPVITGVGTSPSIEVRSTPYRIAHSYEQISQIAYRLDQDSYVTVKLLPPGISDPASPSAIVLTNGVLQPARSGGQPVDHALEWKGYDNADTNNILVSEEGSYTFTIQATSVATGASSLYRGALQLWQ